MVFPYGLSSNIVKGNFVTVTFGNFNAQIVSAAITVKRGNKSRKSEKFLNFWEQQKGKLFGKKQKLLTEKAYRFEAAFLGNRFGWIRLRERHNWIMENNGTPFNHKKIGSTAQTCFCSSFTCSQCEVLLFTCVCGKNWLWIM